MREIKFRAWDEVTKEMWYPKDYPLMYHSEKFNSAELLQRYDNCMQYTGLKDKNGKEIYEGDILDFIFDGVVFIENTYYVIFDNGYFGIKKPNFNPLVSDCENIVIRGNIYENPELLK